jgi:hypothetical protein
VARPRPYWCCSPQPPVPRLPPLAACVRSLLPSVVKDASRLPAVFAFESTALELTFILGPPLALGIGALWSTGVALILTGLLMLAGTLALGAVFGATDVGVVDCPSRDRLCQYRLGSRQARFSYTHQVRAITTGVMHR